jgi:hypothetical protein
MFKHWVAASQLRSSFTWKGGGEKNFVGTTIFWLTAQRWFEYKRAHMGELVYDTTRHDTTRHDTTFRPLPAKLRV